MRGCCCGMRIPCYELRRSWAILRGNHVIRKREMVCIWFIWLSSIAGALLERSLWERVSPGARESYRRNTTDWVLCSFRGRHFMFSDLLVLHAAFFRSFRLGVELLVICLKLRADLSWWDGALSMFENKVYVDLPTVVAYVHLSCLREIKGICRAHILTDILAGFNALRTKDSYAETTAQDFELASHSCEYVFRCLSLSHNQSPSHRSPQLTSRCSYGSIHLPSLRSHPSGTSFTTNTTPQPSGRGDPLYSRRAHVNPRGSCSPLAYV